MNWSLFVTEKYYEYCDDCIDLHLGKPVSFPEYWKANKWFLKKLYKSMYINS